MLGHSLQVQIMDRVHKTRPFLSSVRPWFNYKMYLQRKVLLNKYKQRKFKVNLKIFSIIQIFTLVNRREKMIRFSVILVAVTQAMNYGTTEGTICLDGINYVFTESFGSGSGKIVSLTPQGQSSDCNLPGTIVP